MMIANVHKALIQYTRNRTVFQHQVNQVEESGLSILEYIFYIVMILYDIFMNGRVFVFIMLHLDFQLILEQTYGQKLIKSTIYYFFFAFINSAD